MPLYKRPISPPVKSHHTSNYKLEEKKGVSPSYQSERPDGEVDI